MGRAPCCDKANVKKGPWSPEEDSKLKAYIEKHGTGGNWIALPQKVGLKRCGKSCRLRWLNYLRPNIKHGGFSEEEDNIICGLYISIGSRWSIIAAQLPGRTDNDIKNYWNTRLKKKLLGKRKDQHTRRLAAAAAMAAAKHAQMNDLKRYVPSEANNSTSVYATQPAAVEQQMNMNVSGPYANFSHGITPQLFEQTTCAEAPTIADTRPSIQSSRFQLNLQQAFDHQILMPDNNTSFRKLIERLEASLIDRSNNMNFMTTSQMHTSNCITSNNINNTSLQIPHSTEYDTAYPPLDYGRCIENEVKLESPSLLPAAALPHNDTSLVFSASSISSGSPEPNYQSAWTNTLNVENNNTMNMEACEFSMDMNDLLYCTYNNSSSVFPQQKQEYNNGYGPSLGNGTMNTSAWTTDMKSSSSSSIYPYTLPSENGLHEGIYDQEGAMFEL
ncbi:hypothetical protein SUGI_0899000 [Cryptomeria japonica]|uniref:transcription factor RAX3 n=1 Tax=Cryptomeria japonica TaxID=3369 RepID=UPI0024146F97|nr:transcription factor RAX3 [Cryptomeria japonica]GLJ43292.1 hypothetical protein SUGI_0899000 [Cryptomeria japonica]